MEEASDRAALRRVIGEAGGAGVLELLADELPGADLTTLLLEVFRRRAASMSAPEVLRRYRTDRFVSPATVDFATVRRAEDAMLAAFRPRFDILGLAPVLPLGTHAATGDVDPRNVIATIRGTEVAADPTNGLALEAAVGRRRLLDAEPRSSEPVRLAATQRVTRAQFVGGPISFAHFQLLGAVTAGRDTGSRTFEREHLIEQLRCAAGGLASLGVKSIQIAITCLDKPSEQILDAVGREFGDSAGVEVADAPGRESGRAYYRGLCFKVFVHQAGGSDPLEVGDGGFVDWTAKLLGNQKERLLISGYGLDRIAMTLVG
jgi:hypothetical protein